MHALRKKDSSNEDYSDVERDLHRKYPGCTLFGDPRSPYVRCVMSVLEEICETNEKMEYTLMVVDLSKMEHKSKEIIKLNSRGKIPLLLDEGKYICTESWPIVEFVVQNYQEKSKNKLYPETLLPRTRCDQINFISAELMELVVEGYTNVRGVLRRGESPKEEQREQVTKFLKVYDHFLSQKPKMLESNDEEEEGNSEYKYLGVNYFNCADIFAVVPLLTICTTLQTEEEVFQDFPRVQQWFRRVMERPSFKRSNYQGAKDLSEAYLTSLKKEGRGFPNLEINKYETVGKRVQRYKLQ